VFRNPTRAAPLVGQQGGVGQSVLFAGFRAGHRGFGRGALGQLQVGELAVVVG
jgi:hypothetical protein